MLIPRSRFAGLALVVGLAGCNSAGPPPAPQASTPPPGYATERYTPQGFALPSGEGCQGDVSRFRAVMSNDYGTGNVSVPVYRQITAEIDQADHVCAAGEGAKASAMIRAIRAKFGYP